MNSRRLSFTLVVLGLLLVTAAPSMAQLVRAYDSPHIFWIDRFGIRHHVANPDIQREFFGAKGDRNVSQIPYGELMSIPEGGPLTWDTPPEFYNSRSDRVYRSRIDHGYGGWEPRRRTVRRYYSY